MNVTTESSTPTTHQWPVVVADCKIVIPTYNECENIEAIISQVLAHPRFQVLVVDDNSPDGTGDLVDQMARNEPRIKLIRRPSKLGLGTAYVAGFRQALQDNAQYIFEMDADFSHDPIYLPQFLQKVEQGCDMVVGSRYMRGGGTRDWNWLRQCISRGGNLYAGALLNLPVADCTSGFRCYRRRVIEAINLCEIKSNGYAFQIEMVYRVRRAGFKIAEMPILFPDRRVGQSKMSRRIVVEAFVNVLRMRLNLP